MTAMQSDAEIVKYLESCYNLKPEKLFMSKLKWRYLVRSALRGKNIILLGPAGQGKTLAVQCLVDAMGEIIEEEMTEEQLNALRTDPAVEIIKTEEIR